MGYSRKISNRVVDDMKFPGRNSMKKFQGSIKKEEEFPWVIEKQIMQNISRGVAWGHNDGLRCASMLWSKILFQISIKISSYTSVSNQLKSKMSGKNSVATK